MGAFLAASTAAAELTAPSQRVLIIHSFVNAAPPFTTHSIAFETELMEKMGKQVDLDEISLDVARYTDLDMEEALVELMRKRQTRWQPDLVVPVGSPAGVFVAKYRDRLFPKTTPVIYTGMDERRLPPDAFANAGFVGESFDLAGMVEDMLQIAPATTNIVAIIGASPVEQYWADAFRREWAPFTNRVSFTWLDELSFDQILERVSKLPPRSFVFVILLMRDAIGVTHNQDEALKRISAVANAPVNGIFQEQMGLGIVGGRLYQAELEGVESARIAIRVLRGESITNFSGKIVGPLGPRYDSRQLRRWNISEDLLPPDSLVLFREPTTWERYKGRIVAVVMIILAQAAIISILLMNLVRRRRAEESLAENENRMRLAAEAANLGMWVWNLADKTMWVSSKWKEIYGYSEDSEVNYDRLIERVHHEDREAVQDVIAEAFNDRGSFYLEHRILLPKGGLRWISQSGRLEEMGKSGAVHLLGISIDVTERREAEQAAREVSGKLITAQEDERRRIARDLHDDLNQRLALLSVETDLLGRMKSDAPARKLIAGIATRLKEISSEVHKLSYQLHPAKLDQLGLVSAARSFCHGLTRQSTTAVEFVHDDIPLDLDRDVSLCLYRLIQEGLQNTIKHSRATAASVELRRDGDELRLVVSDNGRGFDLQTVTQHAGLGLTGMRERVRLVHGRVEFHSTPGKGTRVEASVPLALNSK